MSLRSRGWWLHASQIRLAICSLSDTFSVMIRGKASGIQCQDLGRECKEKTSSDDVDGC